MQCLLLSRGETRARIMINVLRENGIEAHLTRPPHELTRSGCGYAAEVGEGYVRRSIEVLRRARLSPSRTYCRTPFGYEEVFR